MVKIVTDLGATRDEQAARVSGHTRSQYPARGCGRGSAQNWRAYRHFKKMRARARVFERNAGARKKMKFEYFFDYFEIQINKGKRKQLVFMFIFI